MTPEALIKQKIRNWLVAQGAYVFAPVQQHIDDAGTRRPDGFWCPRRQAGGNALRISGAGCLPGAGGAIRAARRTNGGTQVEQGLGKIPRCCGRGGVVHE